MSQIWPDIPEFDGVPEVLRSGLWMKAYTSALGRPTTWLLGLLGLSACAGACGALGFRLLGTIGAVLGASIGLVIAFILFVRVILEWQARRLVPSVRAAAGWPLGATTRPGDLPIPGPGSADISRREPPQAD